MQFRQCAFTLVEVLVASTILAIAAIGLAQTVVTSQSLTHEAIHNSRANVLVQALMDEILALPYDDPEGSPAAGPDAGESSRPAFDNMDDFAGFSESAGAIVDATAASYPAEFAGFSRQVQAMYTTSTVSVFSQSIHGLKVVIEVQDSAGHSWTLTRFIPDPSG